MDNVFDFIQFVLSVLVAVVGFIFFCIQIFKTGNIKKSLTEFEEFLGMSNKIKHSSSDYVQSFQDTVPDYILNMSNNELEQSPIDKNVQDFIKSYINVALDKALEKFLPDHIVEDDAVADYSQKYQDLCTLADSIELAEEYRERFNLPDSYTIADIYSFIDKQAVSLKDKINSLKSGKGDDKNGENKT